MCAAEIETGVFNIQRGVPWHGLGVENEGFMTADKLLKLAGLDWSVEKMPMFVFNNGTNVEVPDDFAIVRSTDSKVLGVVGNRYVPAQNVEVLNVLDSIIGSGQAAYDSAWSLRGGKTVAITVELGERKPVAEGEEIRSFITAMNTHDGSGKIRFVNSNVRVVCMNTLALAISTAKATFERKHTTNALSKVAITEAREVLQLAEEYRTFIDATAKQLIGEAFSKKQFSALAERLIIGDLPKGEKAPTQAVNRLDELKALYVNSPNLQSIKGTKWGAWNAVVEFVDYGSKYRGDDILDKRAESIMLGRGVQQKTAAYELLLAA